MSQLEFRENVPLAPLTTFRVGGAARYLCEARSEEDLRAAAAFAKEKGLSLLVLGGGSNMLVSEEGFPGVVARMTMAGVTREERDGAVFVTAAAGESWDGLVAWAVAWGLWGVENLSLIPGTVGAAPVQNIGAYGTEVKDVIESVRAMDLGTGAIRDFSNAECRFSYRESFFKTEEGKRFAILSVTFRLSAAPRPNLSYKDLAEAFVGKQSPSLSEIRAAVIAIRTGKFPNLAEVGTAGSFWKNPIICRDHYDGIKKRFPDIPGFTVPVPADSPYAARGGLVKVPLAWILDRVCGLKGFSMGKVGLFKNQPLVLVAERGASAADVLALEAHVEGLVKERAGIEIEREVQIV